MADTKTDSFSLNIVNLCNKWATDFNAGNAPGCANAYAEGATLIVDGNVTSGRMDIMTYWRKFIVEGWKGFVFRNIEVSKISDTLANATADYESNGAVGKALSVTLANVGGSWQIVSQVLKVVEEKEIEEEVSTEYSEYITYDDDKALGAKAPAMDSLKLVGDGDLEGALKTDKFLCVIFWAKFLKDNCFPMFEGMSTLNKTNDQVECVGVAIDPKEAHVARFIEKNPCSHDFPLAFDADAQVKNAFNAIIDKGSFMCPQIFVLNKDKTIVWRQCFSKAHRFEKGSFMKQLNRILAGEELRKYGNAPAREEDDDEPEEGDVAVEEAQDFFSSQGGDDAFW